MAQPTQSDKATDLNEVKLTFYLYDLATGDDDARLCRDIPDEQCHEQPKSFLAQVTALALSKTGDALADSKIVLPWLMGAVGAPAFLIGFLVPIRESLALLPQILVGSVIRRFPVRKWFWVLASLAQGICVLLMGSLALLGWNGAMAGWTILGLLTLFSLARGVASIAAKDTLGKTVSKGRRGRVNGYAATVSGASAALVGIYLAFSPEAGRPEWLLFVMIFCAGVLWIAASASFSTIEEYKGATEGGRSLRDLVAEQMDILAKDGELQKFLCARALMISIALAGPVYVNLAQRETGQSLDGLGWLMVASGLAGAFSSSFWGSFSDKSSRLTMASGALLAGLLGPIVFILPNALPQATETIYFYAICLFVLGIAHSGVRIGRKTHLIDLADGDQKAEYVALSNTLIGVLLLVLGGVVGILIGFGLELALIFLSATATLGAVIAFLMKDVQYCGARR